MGEIEKSTIIDEEFSSFSAIERGMKEWAHHMYYRS